MSTTQAQERAAAVRQRREERKSNGDLRSYDIGDWMAIGFKASIGLTIGSAVVAIGLAGIGLAALVALGVG